MPYNPETEKFYQDPSTVVDSTPDGDSVRQGFDDRATPAIEGIYQDFNLLKVNGMIGVGIPATETARGIGRSATAAEVASGVTGANGPAWVTPELLPDVPVIIGYISEFRSFFEQKPPTGWAARNGAVLSMAHTDYPELWEYLHKPENAWKCKTLAQWNSLSSAAGGVGGVPFFVVDDAAKTIKLPDTRGDYARCAGSSYLQTVGGWHDSAIVNITGSAATRTYNDGSGALKSSGYWDAGNPDGGGATAYFLGFDASRRVRTAADNRTRTFALLGCVYVGLPT